MRITQSETCRNFASDLETLNDVYYKISRQVSSGKRLTQLSDSPEGSADLLSLTDLATDIDQFRSSADTVSYFLGTADSVLNEVNNLFTSVAVVPWVWAAALRLIVKSWAPRKIFLF